MTLRFLWCSALFFFFFPLLLFLKELLLHGAGPLERPDSFHQWSVTSCREDLTGTAVQLAHLDITKDTRWNTVS